MKNIRFLLIAFLVGSATLSIAQSYLLDNDSSTLSIFGTSTLHDWEITADSIIGTAEIDMNGSELKGISLLNLIVPIATMHSGLEPMDVNLIKAMTINGANSIDFNLIKTTKLTPNTIGGYTIQADGEISIINNVKTVRLQTTMVLEKNGRIRFKGETLIDMTDYAVEPPMAVMGTIITGKDVKIVYDVVFRKN